MLPNPQSVPTQHAQQQGFWGQRWRMPGGWEITFGQVGLITGIVFYSLAIPGDFKYKLDGMGFGVCHQIHSHSFTIGGHQMPLCARCTGMYLGALATLLLLATLRRRASRLPVGGVMAVLAVFFGAMVFDGLNSTLQTFGSGVWDTTNLIRIVTGGLAGISVAAIFYPVFNISLWHWDATPRKRALEQPFELVGYVVAAGILVALVLNGGDWLYYPLAILSVAGVLSLLTMATTMLVLVFTRREGMALTFSEVLTPLLLGLFVSLVLLTLIAWGRASLAPNLANQVGMPLVPGLP